MRSKFHVGYTQPTMQQIETFLTDNFKVPEFKAGEKIIYFRQNELHKVIDDNFHYATDKTINRAVFRKLNYLLVERTQFHHKMKYKAIPLVIIKK